MQVWFHAPEAGTPEHEYQLEYREGSEAQHYQCFTSSGANGLTEVTEAFISFLHNDDSWRTKFKWRQYTDVVRMRLNIGDEGYSDLFNEEYLIDSLKGLLTRESKKKPFPYIALIRGPDPGNSLWYVKVMSPTSQSCLRDHKNSFRLEYREGYNQAPYESFIPANIKGLAEVTSIFIKYLQNDISWKTQFEWARVSTK